MFSLIVFLGNPGKEYQKTRHNAGFLLSDYLFENKIWTNKFSSLYRKEGNTHILKPQTFMNLSGKAVQECASFFKIEAEEILVIHDTLSLPLGEVRLQNGGSLEGHNGLRDIKSHLKTDSFYRLRIGIGRPMYNDVRTFVTSQFTKEEMIKLTTLFSLLPFSLIKEEKEIVINL